MAKIKIKSKKKEEEPPFDLEPLGTMEQMKSKEHLEQVRSKHREGGTLDNYCDMLETQINSLVEKILTITEQPVPTPGESNTSIIYHPESDSAFIGNPDEVEDECVVFETANEFFEWATKDSTHKSARKHIEVLRTHIASAVSELNDAVFYARDNIDK